MQMSQKDRQAWINGIRNKVATQGVVTVPALKKGGVDYTSFILYMSPYVCKKNENGTITIAAQKTPQTV